MTNFTNCSPCFLYGLFDPRDESYFYVGVSKDPSKRLPSHRSDPGSAAFERVREIIRDGFQVELHVLRQCKDRNAALYLEYQIVQEFPGLLNRARDLYQATGRYRQLSR